MELILWEHQLIMWQHACRDREFIVEI